MQKVISFRDAGGELYDIPEDEAEAFRADRPEARPVRTFRGASGELYDIPEEESATFQAEMPQAEPVRSVRTQDGEVFDVPESERATFLKGYRTEPEFQADREAVRARVQAQAAPEQSVAGAAARGAGEGAVRGLKDAGLTLASGVVAVPQVAVGLADIAAAPVTLPLGKGGIVGRTVGKVADFQGTRDFIEGFRSEEQRDVNRKVQSAHGFVGTLKAMARHPTTIAHGIIGSTPTMMAGGTVGQALGMAGMGATAAGALGEGLVTAGQMQEETRARQPTGLTTPLQTGAAVAAGATTAAIAGLANKLAGSAIGKKLGLGAADIDTLLAGGTRGVRQMNLAHRLIAGAAQEGLLEEFPQSANEKIFENLATGRPWHEGVVEAGVAGAVVGATMGAGANLVGSGARPLPPPAASSRQSVVGSGQSPTLPNSPLPNSPLPTPAFAPEIAARVPVLDTSPLPPSPFAAPPAPQPGPTLKAAETLMVNRQVVEGWEAAKQRRDQEMAQQAADAKTAAAEQRKAVRAGTAESKAARARRLSMDSFWEQHYSDFGGLPMIERILAGQSFRAPYKKSGGEYDAWKSLIEKYPELGMMMSRKGAGDGKGVPIDVAALEEKMTPDEMVAQIEREWIEYQAWKARDGRTPEDLHDEEIAAEAEYNLTTPAEPRPAELKPGDMVKTPDGQWRRVEREPDTVILADGTDIALPEESAEKLALQAHVPAGQPGIDEARQAYTEQERAMWADAERERIAAETGAPEAAPASGQAAVGGGQTAATLFEQATPDEAEARILASQIELERNRWSAIESTYQDALKAETARPDIPLKDMRKVGLYRGHGSDTQVIEEVFVNRTDEKAADEALRQKHKVEFGDGRWSGSSAVRYIAPKSGEPTYEEWKSGARPDYETTARYILDRASVRADAKGKESRHARAIRAALDKRAPVSSVAVDAYGIELPSPTLDGEYVRDGKLYVFRDKLFAPSTPSPASRPPSPDLTLQGQTQAEMDAHEIDAVAKRDDSEDADPDADYEGTRFRRAVTPEQDKAYMDAVERGDTATAQRMVDEAAKRAGYNVGPVWHGTNWNGTEFREGVTYFTDRKSEAQMVAQRKRGQRVIAAYLKINKPYQFERTGKDRNIMPGDVDDPRADGVITDDGHYVVFFPSQIKFADAVTRDDAGRVIPLSKRFNPAEAQRRRGAEPVSPSPASHPPSPDLALQGQTQAEMDAEAAARQTDAQRQAMLARAAAPLPASTGDQTAIIPGMENEVNPNLFDAADIEARRALGMEEETGDGGREARALGSRQSAAGGGARGMAQADGTGLPGQMEAPDAAAVPADNPHYSIFPIELPEAVDFARQATGKFPKVKKRIRLLGGTALGVYRSTAQGPLGIELKRSIFNLITDQDRARIAAEAEAWAAVNLEGNPEGELWTSAVQDRITEETDKLREQRLKENPRLASSVLLHEIGHWIDNVPDYETMMKRGNILGHLQALHGYTKQMMMEHPDTLEAAIPPRERARMRREAERAAGRRPADDAERKVWSEEVSTHYQDMLQEEAARRGLVTRAEILSELEPLIAWWHGTDSIPEYFTDPAEMYADAFSVLANNPAAMRKRAPTYFKVWQNWLAKRPQARELWERYQMDATLGRVGDMRDRRQMEGIEAANFEHEKQLRARMVWSPRQNLDALGSMLYSGAYPITRRAKKLMKRGAESGDRMMKALQDERYRHAWGAAYMMEVQDKVGRRVFAEAGVPLAEWRAFLQNRQIAENRQGIASMMGMNPAASSEALERQRQRMGDAAYNAMMQAQAQWHALRQKYVINLALEKGLVTQELADLMEQRAAYSHVAAVDADVDPVEAIFRGAYGEAGAKIYKQEGFLGLARDPWQATLELDRSLITAAYRNELKAALESMLADSGEELYRDAGTKWDANVKRMVPVTGESVRASTLVYMRNGKPRSYWAPQEIVDFVDNADPVSARVLTSLINTLLRKQKGVFTWLNYGFPIFNTPRDIQDWIRNLPGWKGRLTYYHYAKRARPLVQSIVDGRPTEEAAELMRQNILLLYPQGLEPGQDRFLQSLGQKIGGRVGRALEATGPQTALERTIQGYGLRPEWMGMDVNARQDLMQRVKRWYLSPTEKGEMLRKVSAWLYLRDRFPDMSAEDVQRNVQMMGGSPDFADRARKNAVIDAVFPFYNPFLRGWQSALTAFAREPVRVTLTTMRYTIVPKLILAAIGAGYMRELLKRLLGDLGDEIGKEQQKMVQYIPQYYKDNYAVHPLWWDPTDPTGTKVVFETSPLSEFNRFAGATTWSLLDGGDIKSILDVGAEQLPGINPVLTLASQWAQVYSGRPPAGTGITQTQIDAGAAVSPMMRETWNQLSGGMLGRIPREGIGDVNLSPLEKFLRLPGVSNTLGRRLRVSNKGFSEGLREAAKPAERERAKVRTEAWRDALEYARTGTLPVEAAVRQARGAMTMAMKPDGRDTSSYLALLPVEQSRDAYYVERLHDYMLQMNIAKLAPREQAMLKAPWTQKAELLRGYGKPPVDKPSR